MSKRIPFIEKYKPKKYEDLIIDKIIHTKIASIIEAKDVPHLILTGRSGIGKTCTIHTIIRAIYARETISSAVLELNAGDDRGIHAIQDKIINFCKHTVDFVDNYMQKKIVILDEADSINSKAQRIINLLMEKYSNTKFIFICNNSTDIIESIQSRCVIIRYSKPPVDKVVERLELICNNEKIKYEKTALKLLYDVSHKDIRQTINLLELLYFVKDGITIENIELYCDIPSHTIFSELLNYIIKKDVRYYKNNYKISRRWILSTRYTT